MAHFSDDQYEIFQNYKQGKNIFITGPGGCGKSFLIKHIVTHAKENIKKMAVCAMTGCAAVLLDCGATTVHSWAGIGLAKADDDVIIKRISLNKFKRKNWLQTQLLIIDEVSMMSKRMFELLDAIGKQIRKSAKPFGGIQVIMSGDFYQLPPVGNKGDPDSYRFCFESPHWDDTFDYQMLLDKPFRQTDEEYIEVLNQIREGKLYKNGYDILRHRVKIEYKDKEIKPVKLYPIKKSVEAINKTEINKLDGEFITYKYTVKYEPTEEDRKMPGFKEPSQKQMEIEEQTILKNSLFEKELSLKKGSQVMCIKNIDLDNGICNGSTGIVINFDRDNNPIVKFSNTLRLIQRETWQSETIPGFGITQIPLILAWAVTIHKSQGATLDMAEVDIGSSIFSDGQTYVALSRVKSIDGLYINSFNPTKINANKKVIEFYTRFYDDDIETDEE